MTINEFKAWLEGFSEGVQGAPTISQWNKIKARIDSLDSQPVKVTRELKPIGYDGWPKIYGEGIKV